MSETRAVNSNRVARPEQGVRVLVIDDNAVCLQVLAFALRKCGYEVTATTKATQALEMLIWNKDDFDIVITDVVRADMDGFKLLEIIGLEMDIPVIMTSANGDETILYKGLQHGARDYLVKPVRMEHLRNIWWHVDRKTAVDDLTAGPMRGGKAATNTLPQEKHQEKTIDKEDEKSSQPNRENSARKKSRISWTRELHKKFVQAVQKLGVDGAVPKRILEAMNEPELTRKHVASHLQKYRISLRKQKASMEQKYATTTTMSTVKHTPILDSSNRSTKQKYATTTTMSTAKHTPLLDSSNRSTSCKNLDTIFSNQSAYPILHPRQHHFSLQQNIAALKRGSQMPPTVPIPVFSNVIQGSFIPADPHKFIAKMPPAIYSGRKMGGDYTEVSGRVPSFNSSQSSLGPFSAVAGQDALSNHPSIRISPSLRSPYAFSAFGAPYPMYGNVVTQRTLVPKAEYPDLHVPNSLTGLHEGRGLFTSGRTTGSAVDTRSQIDVTKGNDQMMLMDSETKAMTSIIAASSGDGDHTAAVKQTIVEMKLTTNGDSE